MANLRPTKIFKHFFRSELAGGLILMICTAVSLFLANSNSGNAYIHFWQSNLDLSFSYLNLSYSIEEWIDQGLMTIFFLMVGLELERELYVGELSGMKNASLPIAAAIGGMCFPALIHFTLNYATSTQPGVGIPIATDIAFSLGILSLLGGRVPVSLKIFLTALAIIDDLGSVIIIAIFYNKDLHAMNLIIALCVFLFLIILNRMNVFKIWIYLIAGVIMWYFMLKSGIHATISGVMLAFAIPFRRKIVTHPSLKLQQALHRPVNFVVVPLFALANTGVHFVAGWYTDLLSKNSLGILFGLVLGKPFGILILSWAAVKMKWSSLPNGLTWKILIGAGILAGIGFTMSIFITNLAFSNQKRLIDESKIAIFIASLIATVAGLITLKWAIRVKVIADRA